MRFLSSAILIFFCILLTQCLEPGEPIAADIDSGYFPLDSISRTYRIKTIHYNDFTGAADSTIVQILDSVISHSGSRDTGLQQRERYLCTTDSGYLFQSNYYLAKTAQQVIRTSGSEKTVAFVFPVTNQRSWNVYAYNSQEPTLNRFQNKGSRFMQYPNTVTVVQKTKENKIQVDTSIAVYAYGAGLIYLKRVNIEKDFDSGKILSGYSTEEQLIP